MVRWYAAVGVTLGIGATYALRKAAVKAFLREWLGGPPAPTENYIQIAIPFTIKDMDIASARKVADSLKPRLVTPVFDPPALDFHFDPIVISTRFVQFRWQPARYRRKLVGRPSKGAIRRLAEATYRTAYKTRIDKIATGWKVTLVAEVPL